MKIYFCLPAYNEENAIGELLKEIYNVFRDLRYSYKVIVVNDGSTDKTPEIVEHYSHIMPVEMISHSHNQGLGEALNSGFKYICHTARPIDVIVCMDSDNTHKPIYVYNMIKKIEEGFDIVIASRYMKESKVIGVSPFRLLMSYGARFMFQIFTPIKGIKDYTCGFRAFKVSIICKAYNYYKGKFITQKGFACTDEILLKLSKLTNKITEVPFILRYDEKKGNSKLKLFTTIKATLKLLINYRKL